MKRRLTMLFFCCLLMASVIAVSASADNTASQVENFVTVNSDGDCMVSTTIRLMLETPVESLSYPVSADATNITVNGGIARTDKTDSAIYVDLTRAIGGMIGEINVTLNYNIPNAVKARQSETEGFENYLQLEVPLLSGFSLSVQKLKYVVTLPGDIKYYPTYSSTYLQESFEANLERNVEKNLLSCSTINPLNDHETVTLFMVVPNDMFPSISTYIRVGNPELVPMLIFGGLALLYWLLFLRTWPLIRSRSMTPPEGVTAGEMGCHLTMAGGDLTMMIINWAQLGYIMIQLDGSRVILHKRMDMGNERSPFEIKCYKLLFGNRRTVDATSMQYAKLSRQVFAMVPGEKNLNRRNSGNMKIFRALCCGAQVFCGICVAMNLTTMGVLQVLLSIILGILGAVSAWQIHEIAYRTHLRGKTRVYIGLVCILIWIVLGILCGEFWIPFGAAMGQFLAGYLAAYGGRRSDLGRQDAGRILGLRSYLKRISSEEISRMTKTDPDYFFNMAPYALSLGVILPFARGFGGRKIDQCPYLVTGKYGKRTAIEWAELLAATADLMDSRYRRMEIEKWIPSKFR